MSDLERQSNGSKLKRIKFISPDPETDLPIALFPDEHIDPLVLGNPRFELLSKIDSLGELGSEVASMAGFARRFRFTISDFELPAEFELTQEMADRIQQEWEEHLEMGIKVKRN